jgi:hypothetical protein
LNTLFSVAFSCRAEARSVPNGFSTISRAQGVPVARGAIRPCAPSWSAVGPNTVGGVAR